MAEFFSYCAAFKVRSVERSVLLCSLVFLLACSSHREQPVFSPEEYKEHLENANRIIVRDEKKDIEEFISRHQFRMESTGTGLRYQILSTGSGAFPEEHDLVVLGYRLYLLSGSLLYERTDTFRLAEGRQVRGVEEALRLFREGTKARIVLPAHLAYGMIGDEDKVPGATPLFYDLHLISVRP
jgi:FKBP-type peptidyl-prolyl cis-trans isomerase